MKHLGFTMIVMNKHDLDYKIRPDVCLLMLTGPICHCTPSSISRNKSPLADNELYSCLENVNGYLSP